MSYLDKLLEGVEVGWRTLGEVIGINRSRRLFKSQLNETGEYAIFQNCMISIGYYNESNVNADTTFIISAGSAGEIGYSSVDFWAADDVYYFTTQKITGQVRRSSVPRISKQHLKKKRMNYAKNQKS